MPMDYHAYAKGETQGAEGVNGSNTVSLDEILALFFEDSNNNSFSREHPRNCKVLITPSHIHSEDSENGLNRGMQRFIKREAYGSKGKQEELYMSRIHQLGLAENRIPVVIFTEHNIMSATDIDAGRGSYWETPNIHSAEITTKFGDFIVYAPQEDGISRLLKSREVGENEIINALHKILESGGTVIIAHPSFVPPNGNRTYLKEASPESIEKYPPYILMKKLVDRIGSNEDMISRVGVEIYNATRTYETHLNLAFAVMLNRYAMEKIGSNNKNNRTWLITPIAGGDSHTGRSRAYLELLLCSNGGNVAIYPGMSYIEATDEREPLTRQYFRQTLGQEIYTFRIPEWLKNSEQFRKIASYLMELGMRIGASFSPGSMAYAFKRNGGYQRNGGMKKFEEFFKRFEKPSTSRGRYD